MPIPLFTFSLSSSAFPIGVLWLCFSLAAAPHLPAWLWPLAGLGENCPLLVHIALLAFICSGPSLPS